MPVPVREIASGEPGALLLIETLPLAAPDVVGENLTSNDVFWPALMVVGTVKPEILKAEPLAVAAEIVTLAVPVFESVTGTVPLLPTSKLPKLMLDGLALSAP